MKTEEIKVNGEWYEKCQSGCCFDSCNPEKGNEPLGCRLQKNIEDYRIIED